MSSKKPKPQATPTLAGLAVTWPDGERCVYPWTQVRVQSNSGISSCCLREPDGRRLRSSYNLSVVRLADPHLAELCRRAQRRYFRNSWRSGNLNFVQHYDHDRVFALAFGLFFVLLSAIFTVWTASPFWTSLERDLQLPKHVWMYTLGVAVLFTLLFCIAPLCLGLWWIISNLLGLSVRRAVWTSKGIEAELSNGYNQSADWRLLDRLSLSGFGIMLHFQDGTRLRFAGVPKLSMTLVHVVRCELAPGLKAREVAEFRTSLKRGAIWCGVGSIAVAVLGGVMRGWQTGARRGAATLAIAALVVLKFVWLRKCRKYRDKRWYRRQRRGSALQSNS